MLEMGTTYLPINKNWLTYHHQAQSVFEHYKSELLEMLTELANKASSLASKEQWVTFNDLLLIYNYQFLLFYSITFEPFITI